MPETLKAGDPVVDFVLPGIDGKTYDLRATRRAGVLMAFVFYKKTCGTCQYTFPYLQRLHAQYAGNRFQIWGIAQENAADAEAFAKQYGATFPQLIDESLDVTEQYDLTTVPGIYLVDETDTILRQTGAFSKEELNTMSRLIAERTGKPYVPVVREEDNAPDFKPG